MVNEISGALEMSAFGPGQIIPSRKIVFSAYSVAACCPSSYNWRQLTSVIFQISMICNLYLQQSDRQNSKHVSDDQYFLSLVQEILQICPALFFVKLQRQIRVLGLLQSQVVSQHSGHRCNSTAEEGCVFFS